MPSFHTINYGCRANQADGAALEKDLADRGFREAEDRSCADIVVVNSCTVTAAADGDVRQMVRRIRRENPAAQILVTGCYAQRSPQELAALPGVQWIMGNSHKRAIGPFLSREFPSAGRSNGVTHPNFVPLRTLDTPILSDDGVEHDYPDPGTRGPAGSPAAPIIFNNNILAQRQLPAAPVFGASVGTAGERTRPNLKVQDGCNNRCSFCIIPSVRGRSRSLPLSSVLEQVGSLCQAGYREVVLTGINLGRYGRDLPAKISFPQMIRAILEETPIERLRLSSVEPMDFSNALLDLMASSPRIAKHVHAPLQSGSDRILRLMYRKYHPHNYRDRILAAYQRMPNAAFGADVMVGFPGESEEDFEQTRSFIDSLPFTYLHVFPFSRRPDTLADKMPDQINSALIRRRSRILRDLAAEKNRQFRQRQVGRTLSAITLGKETPGGTAALSDNYLKVLIAGKRLAANRIVTVRISGLVADRLLGELAPGERALPEPSRI